jgi:hypothetical protein
MAGGEGEDDPWQGELGVLPLIFLALGVGAFAYGFSAHARARIDDYVRALGAAHAAHRAADAHLANMPPSTPASPAAAPVVVDANVTTRSVTSRSVDQALAATLANQRAAQRTADAGRLAQTGAERGAVADSAVRVLERGKKIEEALANLGVGQCGVRSYSHVTLQVRDAILGKLHAEGMTVTGNDPWDIDTQLAGVKLHAVWDPVTQALKLIVTASSFLAPCTMIWERIDRALRGIIGP